MRALLHTVKGNVQLPDGYTELAGLSFNNDCYFTITDFKLTGEDSVRVEFTPKASCNLLGCFVDIDSQKNYSINISTNSIAKYLRYNGGQYKSGITVDTKYKLEVTQTGSYWSDSSLNETWTAKTFTSTIDLCIGTISPGSSASKYVGTIWGDIEVVGRLLLRPCKRDNDDVLGYYDLYGSVFYTPTTGTPTAVTS